MSEDRGARILAVDDRIGNLVALRETLRPLDVEIVEVTSGEEALKLLLREDFALILLDVKMPGMDGFTTAEYIKKLEKTRYIPIIFISAERRDAAHVFRGYETGAVDYLVKPFRPEVLVSKVSVFVQLYEKDRALRALEEMKARQREALEINDVVVQGLVAAKYALELGYMDKLYESIEQTLRSAQSIVTGLMEAVGPAGFKPGDFVRGVPADLGGRGDA